MGQELSRLNDLRREIDAIDDAMHDLLIRRAEASRAIAKVKQLETGMTGTTLAQAMRPAREAAIIRRLLAHHKGDLPAAVIVRIWREIVSSSLRLQASFAVHITEDAAILDLARGFFGGEGPLTRHASPLAVIEACTRDPNSIGVVPLPDGETRETPWWSKLAATAGATPRIVGQLPFIVTSETEPKAFAIGAIEQTPSGEDSTVLRLARTAGNGAKALAALKQAGLVADVLATAADEALLVVDGFIASEDERLNAAKAKGLTVVIAGGYANPIVAIPSGKQGQAR